MYRYRVAVMVVCTGSLVSGLLLAGCAQSADDIARANALKDAQHKVNTAAKTPIHNFDWRADDIARDIGQSEGIEVLRVTGESKNATAGVTVTVRTHGVATDPIAAGGGHAKVDMVVCFQITYGAGVRGYFRVDQTDCPSGAPLAIAKNPQLPDDIEQTLKELLSGSPPPTLGTVRVDVARLDLDPGIRRDVAADKAGVIGIALRASQFDCVMARRDGDQVQAWRPSHVQLAPGELSCEALVAAGGEGLHPPH